MSKKWHSMLNALHEAKKKIKNTVFSFLYRLYYGKKIILLESHEPFDGNSGALYHYMRTNKKYKKYTFVWILQLYSDNGIKNQRRVLLFSKNNKTYRKQWFINHAEFVFFDDVPIRPGNPNAKTIYLTHGCPPIKKVKGIINVPEYVDYAIGSSVDVIRIASEQFSFPREKFIIAGQPRNDVLFEEKKDIKLLFNPKIYSKVILWMPTFRKAKFSDRNDTNKSLPYGIPLFKKEKEIEFLNNFLQVNNTLFVIKLHPLQDTSVVNLNKYSNIITLTSDDLQKAKVSTNTLLLYADALITDYSSVVFDYLLLDRPIAFLLDDLDDYKLGLVDEANQFIFGYKLMNIKELIVFLNDIIDGNDRFSIERKILKKYIHQYQNGGYCKRIIDLFSV